MIILRSILLTQSPIDRDWDWNQALSDIKSLSDLLTIKIQASQPPHPEFLESGLMSYQPNRSNQARSRLPNFDNLDSITVYNRPRTAYPHSIIIAARFLFDRSDLDSYEIFLLQSNAGLPQAIFRLISEFSKVYEARRMIQALCSSDLAIHQLVEWDRSIKTKTLDFFDDESDRLKATKELFDREINR